jgi:hypothetical protein
MLVRILLARLISATLVHLVIARDTQQHAVAISTDSLSLFLKGWKCLAWTLVGLGLEAAVVPAITFIKFSKLFFPHEVHDADNDRYVILELNGTACGLVARHEQEDMLHMRDVALATLAAQNSTGGGASGASDPPGASARCSVFLPLCHTNGPLHLF